MQDDLNTAKVAVAIKAAGLDGEAHWTRQNLAQVIWYDLFLLDTCPVTSASFTQAGPQRHRHSGLSRTSTTLSSGPPWSARSL